MRLSAKLFFAGMLIALGFSWGYQQIRINQLIEDCNSVNEKGFMPWESGLILLVFLKKEG